LSGLLILLLIATPIIGSGIITIRLYSEVIEETRMAFPGVPHEQISFTNQLDVLVWSDVVPRSTQKKYMQGTVWSAFSAVCLVLLTYLGLPTDVFFVFALISVGFLYYAAKSIFLYRAKSRRDAR
jgi:hypothetical protein